MLFDDFEQQERFTAHRATRSGLIDLLGCALLLIWVNGSLFT